MFCSQAKSELKRLHMLLCVAMLVSFSHCHLLLAVPPEKPAAQQPSKRNRKFKEQRFEQRLLKGNLKSRMKAINTIRNSFLDDELATNLLVKACDQLMKAGMPDTSVLLIIDTLRFAAPTPQAAEGLVRWFDQANLDVSNSPETWRLVGLSALLSMRQQRHPAVLKRATELLRSEDYRIQMLAADIVGRQRHAPALDVLIELVNSQSYADHYGFRHAILGAISSFPDKKAVSVLQNQSAKLSGQLSFLVAQQLIEQSNKRVEPARKFKVVRSRLPKKNDGATKRLARSHSYEYEFAEDASASEYQIKAPAYFYGQPIYANDVTFVIDISSSMKQRVGSTTRLGRAKSEAIKAIDNLPATANFRVILFSAEVIDMMGSLVPATQANKAKYSQQIRQLTYRRQTNLYGGLKAALMDASEPEVIFIVSDGEPTAGELLNPADILMAARNLNMFRRITINSISIGRKSPLLQRLAAENDGHCRRVN